MKQAPMQAKAIVLGGLALIAALAVLPAARADSRLLATGGATQLEGAAGGGIVPWAVLAGYGSTGEVGASAFATHVAVDDYNLDAWGAAVSIDNRIELSYARQRFDLGTLGEALGLPGRQFEQDIFGLKLRLFGDLIYGRAPQISAGLLYKRQHDFAIPQAVGAERDRDVDVYLAATRLWLAAIADRNVVTNLTLRLSRANQIGLLGFGGDEGDSHELLVEGSAAVFLTRRIAVGAEYRQQPDNLSFSEQDDWFDLFAGWFPNKHVSALVAYTNVGTVATLADQTGVYASLEIAF